MPLEPREYSKRLGALTPAQLGAALACFDLGEFVAAAPAPGGLFGQNVFLESSRGEFVLRGCPHGDEQLPKERFFARELAARSSVPVPWPYRIEASPAIFGWSFAILPKLPGESAALPETRAALRPGERAEIAAALGTGLADLHDVVWECAGEYELESDRIRPLARSHEEDVVARVRERLAQCRAASDATTDADLSWAESIVERARPALRGDFRAAFVHGDYTEGNVLVERAGDGFRASGVLDLMTAQVGDPEQDLVRTLAYYARADREAALRFRAAYHARHPRRPRFAERLQIYALADSLTLWEYGQRNRTWFRAGQCLRDFAEPFIERLSE